jgi:hypothetical protein
MSQASVEVFKTGEGQASGSPYFFSNWARNPQPTHLQREASSRTSFMALPQNGQASSFSEEMRFLDTFNHLKGNLGSKLKNMQETAYLLKYMLIILFSK